MALSGDALRLFWLFVTPLIAFLVWAVLYGIWISIRDWRNRARFLAQLETLAPDQTLLVGDLAIHVLFSPARRGTLPFDEGAVNSLVLSAEAEFSGSMTIEKEGFMSRLFEAAGLQPKLGTGDPVFDRRYRVGSDDAGFPAGYLTPDKRAAVEGLFAEGCTRIELEPSGLTVAWRPLEFARAADAEFVALSLRHFAALTGDGTVEASAPAQARGYDRQDFDRVMRPVLATALVACLAAGGLMISPLDFQPVDGLGLFVGSLRFSAAALAAFLVAAGAALKGKPWFTHGLARSALAAALLFIPAGYWALFAVNCGLDRAAPAVHRTRVTGKERSENFCRMRVAAWSPHKTVEVRVDMKACAWLAQDQLLSVTTKPGYLGHEWIVGWRPAAFTSSGSPSR